MYFYNITLQSFFLYIFSQPRGGAAETADVWTPGARVAPPKKKKFGNERERVPRNQAARAGSQTSPALDRVVYKER